MKIINLPNDLQLNSSLSIKIYDYKSTEEISKQQILLHKNTFSFLQEGKKEVFFDNASYAIDNSKFLLMKSGHCLMTEKVSKVAEYYRSILLFFSAEDVLTFIRKYDLHTVATEKRSSIHCFEYDNFINKFVDSLIDIAKLSITLQQKILKTKLEEILLYLIDFKGISFLYSLVNDIDNNQKFIQTIESNKLNKLTIKELSFLSNMSVSTFKREFQKHFNSSPSKWFQAQRLEHAAFLLKKQSKRPSDIFEEIGYENLSNFIYAFKSKFGITPKQYQSR